MKDDKFLLILLVVLGFVSFLILKPFLTYVLFSIILTVVSYPLYEKIKSTVRFAPLSAIIIILSIIIIIIAPSIYLTITIFTQTRDIITNIGAAEFTGLQNIEDNLERLFGMDFNFATPLRVWILDLSSTTRSFIIGNIITFTRTVVNFLAGTILMLFIMFYLFIDGRRLVDQIKRQLPIEDKHKDYLFTRAYQTIQGLFLGLFLTAVMQGILAGLGYLIFGMSNVILLGFLTGVFSLIPFLGPPVVYIPASLFLLLQGNLFGGLGLLLYGLLLISNVDNFVRPLVVRFRAKVHPLYVILGVIGGVAFLGLSGIVIGPLVLSLFQEVLEVYQLSKKKR
ncbi:MAG: AI-2E family transporter [Candidatus Aenigmarchaeota archaeon]|nr:AI-2E family transporter [Candidatus Aenigmarchaeota archaeon]